MTVEDAPTWGTSADLVLSAGSLPEAQAAASSLIDRALPGGAAVDVSSRQLLEFLLAPGIRLIDAPHRGYVVAVLVAMATWIGAWRRAATTNSSLEAKGAEEALVEAKLIEFCSAHSELFDDPDPEARSLMGLLVGSVGGAADGVAIMARYEQETEPMVRACLLQGALRLVGRLPESDAIGLGDQLTRALGHGPSEVVSRANMELAGGWWTPSQRERLNRRVTVPSTSQPPLLWPAEKV